MLDHNLTHGKLENDVFVAMLLNGASPSLSSREKTNDLEEVL